MDLWRDVEAVCFDVDSTVCVDEGIDELAEFCGAGKAVAEWTARFYFHLNPSIYIHWSSLIIYHRPCVSYYTEYCFFRAMGGFVPFEEALAARLSLFKPSLSKVEEYLQKRPPRYSFCLLWIC